MTSSEIWKVLRNSGCVQHDSAEFDIDVNDINTFFAQANSTSDDNFDITQFNDTTSFSFRCVSVVEIFEAVNKIKSNAVGIDGIPIRFIKLVIPYICDYILDLVNFILTCSSYPLAWKNARVVPIPKAKNVYSPDDLRPISILPAISKIMEMILKNQILEYTSNMISDTQFAFRQRHNTTHLLLKATDFIRHNINDRKLSVLLSLDLSKAFNSINFAHLITKLRDNFNFSGTACKLIYSFIRDRSQFVAINGNQSDPVSLNSGVPQGSILGPLLFLLYVNDLRDTMQFKSCETLQFADDIFFILTGDSDNLSLFESNVNECLQQFSNWASANYLTINPSKTKALMFGRGNNMASDINVHLNYNNIEFVTHHKILGVIVDNELSFRQHIDALSGRVCFLLRKIYSAKLYMPLRIRKYLAHAVLMSNILYGLEVISGCIGISFTRLQRILNSVVRFVYNVPRRNHISRYVKLFLGCSFTDFVSYRILVAFYNIIKCRTPTSLYSLFVFSHSTRNPQIVIPRIYRDVCARSFLVRIARNWNLLPYELRIFSHSNNVFRKKLFIHFASFEL